MKSRFVPALTVMMITTATICHLAFAQVEPLRGAVINKAENPIKNVEVLLRVPGATEAIEEQITDKEGLFSIAMESLRPGYELHFQKDGYDDVTLPITPQQLVVANIRIIMEPTRVEPAPQPAKAKPTPPPSLVTPEKREQAIELYNKGVDLWEEVKDADDATEMEQRNEAFQMIRQAASMDPDFAEPLRFLGRLAMQRHNWAEASRYSEALIRIDPKDEEAIRDLYVSLVIMRHFKRVGEAAKLLITFDQENIPHVERHAKEFFKNNQIVMARALYEALSEIAPDPINAYLNLGICCASLGDVEGTRAAFEAFIELAPEDHPDLESVRRDLAALDAPADMEEPETQEAPEKPE